MSPLALLGILFVALKLTGFIAWSWWLVTAPFWAIPAILIFPFLVVAFGSLAVFIAAAILSIFEKKRR